MRDGAVMVKDYAVDCNNPKRFRVSVITSVCVLIAMLLLSITSIWAGRRSARATGAAVVPSGPLAPSMVEAKRILEAAVREHDEAARERDGHDRRRRADGALGMLRAAEVLADPMEIKERLGCDTARLRAALASM
jgi:hypothetical protein